MNYSSMFAQLPKGSISETIIERITNALISGELKPGDKIPTETEFSENLGVGRNAVREAIKVLCAFGVLEIRRSEGTFVVDDYNDKLLDPLVYGLILSEHSMEELLEIKIAVSNSIMYIAMKNATDEELAHLKTLGQDFEKKMMDESAPDEECYEASLSFNEYLGDITHNRMLKKLDDVIHKIASFTRHKAIERSREEGHPEMLPENYMKQVRYLEERDESVISEFMDERLEIWKELLL